MARSFRGFSRGRTVSPRRQTAWEEAVGATAPQSQISTSVVSIASAAAVAVEDGLTIVRTRGELLLYLSTAAAAQDGYAGAFGLGIANANAIVAGSASLLTPISDADWDGWFFHQFFFLKAADAIVASGAATEPNQVHNVTAALRVPIDSKAMRKLPLGMAVYGALEVVEVGTSLLNWSVNTRMLLKLP